MSKKIDWDKTYKEPFRKNLGGGAPGTQGKYSSGREMMEKSFQESLVQQEVEENLEKMLPAMEKLYVIRLHNHTPLKVMRPIIYQTSELQKSTRGDEMVNGKYTDVQKRINPGTELMVKSINPSMQMLVFEDSRGEEIEISFSEQKKLIMNTDIYETVLDLYNKGQL